MVRALDVCGNPSSAHAEGRKARALVEDAREQVARLVGARASEVVFTSGATEANATVMAAGWRRIFLNRMEHDSVTVPARASGAGVVDIGVGASGLARIEAFAEAVLRAPGHDGHECIALQLANNETGVIQPVAETAEFSRAHGIRMHCDAVQAAGRMPVDFHALGLDTMSISGHKLGGPAGVGALVIRDGLDIPPLVRGGGQERRRRAGTENVAGIAGFGAACAVALDGIAAAPRIAALRDRLEREAVRLAPDAVVVGRAAGRLPNTSCIALPGRLAETMVIRMDLAGVSISAGAACSSGKVGASTVIAALGLQDEIAQSAIRVSLGPGTREDEIEAFLAAWAAIAGGQRQAA